MDDSRTRSDYKIKRVFFLSPSSQLQPIRTFSLSKEERKMFSIAKFEPNFYIWKWQQRSAEREPSARELSGQ